MAYLSGLGLPCKMNLEAFLLFFGRVWEWLIIILWIFGRIHRQRHLSWTFTFWEVFDYWFSLLTCNPSVKIFYFFYFFLVMLHDFLDLSFSIRDWMYTSCSGKRVLTTGQPGNSQDFLFFHDSFSVGCVFLGIPLFLLACQTCWYIVSSE